MADFATHAKKLDAQADNRLGDSISYSFDGGGSWTTFKGRIFSPDDIDEGADINTRTRVADRKRLRVSREFVPSVDKGMHRLRCFDVLGAGTWRPTTSRPTIDGRYLLVDIEKVAP
jgi:hypothetical protein